MIRYHAAQKGRNVFGRWYLIAAPFLRGNEGQEIHLVLAVCGTINYLDRGCLSMANPASTPQPTPDQK